MEWLLLSAAHDLTLLPRRVRAGRRLRRQVRWRRVRVERGIIEPDMTAPYVELFAALHSARVRYAVVGGLAVVLHGVPRMTFDLDLAADPETANMLALVDTLSVAGYRARVPEPLERLADPTARTDMIAFNVQHPVRQLEDVDILLLDDGEWRAIASSVAPKTLGGVPVPVIGREALVAMKRASGRPQDVADADALEQIAREAGDD
jgi:hypothetical protein